MKEKSWKNKFYFFYGIIIIFAIWFFASTFINSQLIMPDIKSVFSYLGKLLIKGSTYNIIFTTLFKLLLVIFTTLILALILVILSTLSPSFKSFISPFISILRVIPSATIIIVLFYIFNTKIIPFILVFFVILPLLYEGILFGFENIPDDLKDDLTTVSTPNLRTIFYINLPMAKKDIILALLQATGFGFKALIMGEVIALPEKTMGKKIFYGFSNLNMVSVIAWTILALTLAIIIDVILNIIKRKLTKTI